MSRPREETTVSLCASVLWLRLALNALRRAMLEEERAVDEEADRLVSQTFAEVLASEYRRTTTAAAAAEWGAENG